MLEFRIEHTDLHCDIKVTGKYAFIEGPSGAGKSYMTAIHNQILRGLGREGFYCNHAVFPIGSLSFSDALAPDYGHALQQAKKNLETYIESSVADEPGCVFLFDEDWAHLVFPHLKGKNCYAVVISRKAVPYIGYSYRAVYVADKDDEHTYIHRKYPDLEVPTCNTYDSFLTEDSAAGFNFIKQWVCRSAVPCGGKSNIPLMLTSVLPGPFVHVLFDGGGVGYTYNRILKAKRKLEHVGYKVFLWAPECFEELLLGADFVLSDNPVLLNYEPTYTTSKNYLEHVIEDVTVGTHYEYAHDTGFKQDCWLRQCDSCSCVDLVNGDKKIAIFQQGPLPQLCTLKPMSIVPMYFNADITSACAWCVQHPRDWVLITNPPELELPRDKWCLYLSSDTVFFAFYKGKSLRLSLAVSKDGYYIPHGFSYALVKQLLTSYLRVGPAPFD